MVNLKIGVVGCAGRMGRALTGQIIQSEGCEFAGGTEQPDSAAIGKVITDPATGEDTGFMTTGNPQELIKNADAILDFTSPDATAEHARLAAKAGIIHVVGTTGLTPAHHKILDEAARETIIIQSANMSLGINLLAEYTRQLAGILDDGFDIEVLEMHHRHKVDAPSGTALLLGQAAAEGRQVSLETHADKVRDGVTGPRKSGHIGFATLRGGNVAGDHTVIFAADDERIELSHKAGNRSIFARGAVKAALWAKGRKAGRYNMADVLGFAKGN